MWVMSILIMPYWLVGVMVVVAGAVMSIPKKKVEVVEAVVEACCLVGGGGVVVVAYLLVVVLLEVEVAVETMEDSSSMIYLQIGFEVGSNFHGVFMYCKSKAAFIREY